MAAGDIYVRRNNADTSSVPNAGSNEDSGWDTVTIDQGGIVAYTDPNFQLDIGLYLIMYSERFDTTDTTNNERIEIQGEIHVSGTGVVGGYAQDYIRKSSGQQECLVSGAYILDVTANNTDVFIRFYRTDNSTSGTVDRVPGHGSVIILNLDDNDNYGFYSTSASEATSAATERTLNIDTNDRQDTGFTRSGTAVDVANAGRYLITYNLDVSQAATGREDAIGRLTANGTELVGSNSYCYMRGADGTQDGALCGIGIYDLSAGDDIDVRWQCPTSQTITAAAGATLQLWQIPAGADQAIMQATTGDYNANADFTWDTLPFIDTASFTATAGNSNIDVDQQDYILGFATFHQNAPDAVARGYPEVRFNVNGTLSNTAGAGCYHRNSGGSGVTAATVSNLFLTAVNDQIEVNTVPLGAAGAMNNDSGQFALLSLESLFGPYTFPPNITDFNTTEQFNWGDQNLVIAGANFGATQGAGTVEFWDDILGTTQVAQTVDTWSDTSIQIDTVQGALGNDTTVYLVVTENGGTESNTFPVVVGVVPYTDAVLALSPDHLWKLNNVYTDTGITGPQRDMTSGVVGTWVFSTTTICEDTTHSLVYDNVTSRREIVDSPNMNITINSDERTLYWWFQIENIQQPFGCIWKEGAQIQNLALIIGFGNTVLFQMADVAGTRDSAQVFSDFRLTPGRPYCLCMKYTNTEYSAYIDGVKQSVSDGNPLVIGIFDTHSGDVTNGAPDTTLETGTVDITYLGIENAKLAFQATWSDNSAGTNAGALDDTTEIRDVLFRRGAPPDDTIVSGTESAMQTAIDATADTRPDWPLSYRIEAVTGGGDFELIMNDKVFNSRITLHMEYRGSDTLTIVNDPASDFDVIKSFSVTGGTILVVNEVIVTITVVDTSNAAIQSARVRLVADAGGDLAVGTQILNALTNASGQVTVNHRFTSNQPVIGDSRKGTVSTLYDEAVISDTILISGLDKTVIMLSDE